MKRVGKPVFFILMALILALCAVTFLGISYRNGDIKTTIIKSANDIRWGIDIRGGVDVTFTPPEGYQATEAEMDSAKSIIEVRLVNQNITDYELYVDYNKNRIILRFPWKSDEADFNAEAAIRELGETAMLTFREGMETDEFGMPSGVTAENIILQGTDVVDAAVQVTGSGGNTAAGQYVVSLSLSAGGRQKFSEATGRLTGSVISIWMDDTMISYPRVNERITDGEAMITGNFTVEEARDLANKIKAGALPFKLETENYNTISPTLGDRAKDAMLMAGVIAFTLIALFMLILYKVPGLVSCFTLLGQITLIIASLTGFFGGLNSFTLTLPGIAGIILSIGYGVDATVITAERIKEELRNGKTLDGAIEAGYNRAFSAILDGNITVVIVAVILMGVFGPPDSVLGGIFSKIFFMFGPATTGNIYSFGYTLLVGVIFNLIMGVGVSRLMLKSVSKFKAMRRPTLYGGYKPDEDGSVVKPRRSFNFTGNIRKYAILSGALLAVILVFVLAFGVQLDIQFRGGSIVTYAYEGELDGGSFGDIVVSELPGANIQYSEDFMTGARTVIVSLAGNQSLSAEQLSAVTEKLRAEFPANDVHSLEISNVNPTIGGEFLAKSFSALALAVVLMLVYVAIRFRKIGGLSAGAMGVVALLHDCLIVFGVFVIFRMPINSNFIAVILTIIGYSLNDTIVVYDRIRENKKLYGSKMETAELVNLSVNQTLVRCINTTVTTIMSMVVVTVVALVFDVQSILSFSFPLILGLASGTYSSVCLASPLWVKWREFRGKAA